MRIHLTNGKIYCGAGAYARSLSIRDGVITAVDAEPEAGSHVVNLEGHTVLPGLNDSHMHFIQTGFATGACDLSQARSVEEAIKTAQDFYAGHPDLPILSGRGWNHDYFSEPWYLTKDDLDRITDTVPVMLHRTCGNVTALNTSAIRALGITKDTVIPGGDFLRDEDGNCNGVLFGDGVSWAENRLLQESKEAIVDAAKRAAAYAVSKGLTSVQSNDAWNENSDRMFQALHEVCPSLPVRYSHQFGQQDLAALHRYFETEFHNDEAYDEKKYRKGSLKLFKDGALGVRTAQIEGGYTDDPGNTGYERLTKEAHFALAKLAHDHGVTVVTHGIGDGAIRAILDNYKKINGAPENSLRHGIIHCLITTPELIDEIQQYGISVLHQPNFLDYDLQIIEDRVGREKAKTSYAYGSMIRRGIPVSFGSDSPVEDCNPFFGLQEAVTHARLIGEPHGGYNPEERCTVEQAVDAYTIGSAWQEGTESFKGRLEAGYVADLIVLDRDIFTIDPPDIKNIQVEKTMMDGEWVYER